MGDEVIYTSAVRLNDIVIYGKKLDQAVLNKFIKSGTPFLLEDEDMVSYDVSLGLKLVLSNRSSQTILFEWRQYKVVSLSTSSNFKESDFTGIGEFGTETYGTLTFKNCVGFVFFKGIKLLVESEKISSKEMQAMTETVNRYICNLSYDFNRPAHSLVDRNIRKTTDLDYHIYLMIINMLRTTDTSINLFSNFKLIENEPHRQFVTEFEYEDINFVTQLTPETIADIFSDTSNLAPHRNKIRLLDFLPQTVAVENISDSYDNNENRFVKHFISLCLSVVERFQEKFTRMDNFINIELINENKTFCGKLRNLLHNTFLKEVGTIQNITMYSTVLTRKEGYRQLYKMFLGLKSIPYAAMNETDLKEMIENKSLDVLYENFCFFTIADIISQIYGETVDSKRYKIRKSEFSKTLEKRGNHNYFEFKARDGLPNIRLHYNKHYDYPISYSKVYAPDISIEILGENFEITGLYVFDAKFKVEIHSDLDNGTLLERTYKFDDISKMHTYKDALRPAKGAFLLYPGTVEKIFPEDVSAYDGVGAFLLNPGDRDNLTRIKDVILGILRQF